MLDPIALDYIDYLTPYLKGIKNWQLHFCVVPRKCALTEKTMWFKICYRGTRVIDVHDKPFKEHWYIDKNEFIIWSLKS